MRFNALAGYCRLPQSVLSAEELGWFEAGGERVLGTLARDLGDGDFGGVVLGRDRKGRFRAIGLCGWHPSPEQAATALGAEMGRLAAAPDEEYYQGDERGSALDFFSPRVPRDHLSAGFVRLAEEEGFSPARGIIEPMMHWYEDPDGNFVVQFQTGGFDARLWELYLFAAFVEMGYRIDRTHAMPDFACEGILGDFYVEAVTVGPTQDRSGVVVPPPPTDTPEEMRTYRREYMPIKYGSPLTSKLAKRYWDLPHVAGKPLVFAVHDFHAPLSMLISRSALPAYLYGYDEDWEHDREGRLQIHPRKVETHRWREKVIPSGFFDLPDAENVSAVMFSNSGTISRFDRMGLLAGFGSGTVRLVREGFVLDHDPNASEPRPFRRIVNAPDYVETWVEGLEVFHNPRAKWPIECSMLPGASHHHLLPDGRTETLAPAWHPLSSVTHVLVARRL
jgi:hypothetical protein